MKHDIKPCRLAINYTLISKVDFQFFYNKKKDKAWMIQKAIFYEK